MCRVCKGSDVECGVGLGVSLSTVNYVYTLLSMLSCFNTDSSTLGSTRF